MVSFAHANYLDPNLNVSMPIFTIHGNHDDLTGGGSYSAMYFVTLLFPSIIARNLLSIAGLVNYFGSCPDVENIDFPAICSQVNLKSLVRRAHRANLPDLLFDINQFTALLSVCNMKCAPNRYGLSSSAIGTFQ
jgi:DNA repair exonuclease SbcCD nuclease subunit